MTDQPSSASEKNPNDSRLLNEVSGLLRLSPRSQSAAEPSSTMPPTPKPDATDPTAYTASAVPSAVTGDTIPRAPVEATTSPRPAETSRRMPTDSFRTLSGRLQSMNTSRLGPNFQLRKTDRRGAFNNLLILIAALIFFLLMSQALGQNASIQFLGARSALTEPLQPQITGASQNQTETGVASTNQAASSEPVVTQIVPVSPRFQQYYDQRGGLAVFGYAISPEQMVDSKVVQWFERARLETDVNGTSIIFGGLIGSEMIAGCSFPTTSYFVDTDTARFFPETGQAIRDDFLRYWNTNGGLETFGLPVSPEVQERMSDGRVLTVQYFERARFELHPDLAGTPYNIQLGLIGRSLFLKEPFPNIIAPVGVQCQPTR